MTNRDLLKEAIADAKAIKETAIANAKAALEESFTPHLKSILAAKINEMDSYYEEDDVMEAEKEEVDEMKKSEEVEEAMDEINLDELLAELDEAKEEEEMDEAITETEVTEAEEEIEAEETEEEGEEEIDLENMSEEDLKNFIESVIEDMITDGEIEAGPESMEDEAGAEEEETEEEEINIDEILAELEGKEEVEEAKKEEMEEMKKMKDELEEAYAAINTLRSELNEINVLNAKLLYTNKIFKAKNLTESEKVKVLTAFDKATSKKEAQLVYETLIEGLKNKTKSPIKENLGRASKPAGVAPSKKPIVESNDLVARFQKLAGII